MNENHGGVPPIEVERSPDGAPTFVAIVKLRGEHDIATTPRVAEVLTPLKGNLLTDLSECEFVDSSFVEVVTRVGENLQRDGFRLEALVPQEKKRVARVLEVTGATKVVRIRHSLDDGA